MRVVPISAVIIPPNRQRKLFDEKAIEDLRESILSKGLLHPPVVQGDMTLVAGERRLRAITTISTPYMCDGQVIPPGFVPVIFIGDLSPIDIREAELEENIIREPLTWQERARAIAELHELRSEQAAAEGRVQRARDTAIEIRQYDVVPDKVEVSFVTEALIINKHLDDPDVASAKTQKEALNIIRKKAQAAHRARLAEEFEASIVEHKITKGDALELLPQLEEGRFDLIITDPPYGIGSDDFGSMSATRHKYSDTEEYAVRCYEVLAREGFRVVRKNAVAYVFCSITAWQKVADIFAKHSWEIWPRPLIWSKGNGMTPRPDVGPRYTYEAILMAIKGTPPFYKKGSPDVLSFPSETSLVHGAQKPVSLYAELIERSALPGARLLDPFAGSGTIFVAADKMKCVAEGFELADEYYAIAVERILQLKELEC